MWHTPAQSRDPKGTPARVDNRLQGALKLLAVQGDLQAQLAALCTSPGAHDQRIAALWATARCSSCQAECVGVLLLSWPSSGTGSEPAILVAQYQCAGACMSRRAQGTCMRGHRSWQAQENLQHLAGSLQASSLQALAHKQQGAALTPPADPAADALCGVLPKALQRHT